MAPELGLKVESERRIVYIKALIKSSGQYEIEFEFIQEFLNSIVIKRAEHENVRMKCSMWEKNARNTNNTWH